MVFAPKIRPLDVDLESLVKPIKYSRFLGLDFVIGQDGTPYFIEANATPFFTRLYSLLYGNELVEMLVSIYGADKRYGINLHPPSKRGDSFAAGDVDDLCRRFDHMAVDYETFANGSLRFDEEGFYHVRVDGSKKKKRRFDVLLNRQPKARLFKKIPKERRLEAAVISPPELAFVKSKNRTTKEVGKYIPVPINYLVKTTSKFNVRLKEMVGGCDVVDAIPVAVAKPSKGSMARGISFCYPEDVGWASIKSAHVLQQFVLSALYRGRVTTVRTFFVNGQASDGLVYTAPEPVDSRTADLARFMPTTYGGFVTTLSKPANEALKPYVLAAGYAIERAIQERESKRENR